MVVENLAALGVYFSNSSWIFFMLRVHCKGSSIIIIIIAILMGSCELKIEERRWSKFWKPFECSGFSSSSSTWVSIPKNFGNFFSRLVDIQQVISSFNVIWNFVIFLVFYLNKKVYVKLGHQTTKFHKKIDALEEV